MKRIIRLTERDLTRIVRRVLSESESKIKAQGHNTMSCVGGRLRDPQGEGEGMTMSMQGETIKPSCVKVGNKSTYPKTYNALSQQTVGGTVNIEGNKLTFYKDFNGWLRLLGMDKDRISTISTPQSVAQWYPNNQEDTSGFGWFLNGGSIYMYPIFGG